MCTGRQYGWEQETGGYVQCCAYGTGTPPMHTMSAITEGEERNMGETGGKGGDPLNGL